jgi:hypothetical protein
MFDSNHVQNDFIYQTGGSTEYVAIFSAGLPCSFVWWLIARVLFFFLKKKDIITDDCIPPRPHS